MSQTITGIRGMPDILPEEIAGWQKVEAVLRGLMERYGYRELRVPIVERTELFKRSIGEVTDIVEKEMYSFEDRNGEGLTLRPEATAGLVRAGIAHGLFHNQKRKLWCTGPMFRYEKPQKGRNRQFHQFDVEAFGFEGPDVDAELLLMSARIWAELGIEAVDLKINSLGTPDSRVAYRAQLVEYFNDHRDKLDAEGKARLERNPMRLLDSKDPAMQPVIAAAPQITDHLDTGSAAHFAQLLALLDAAGIRYTVDSRLVRGLDYYSRTVFEWVTDRLGSQGAVCAGGRYDGLVEHLGGRATPGIGWALGLERLVELYQIESGTAPEAGPDAYLVAVGDATLERALLLAEDLRNADPDLAVEVNCGGGSFKSQFKRADKSGAKVALILGEAEVEQGVIGIKPLRDERDQENVSWADAAGAIRRYL